MEKEIHRLIDKAVNGDPVSLEKLIKNVQDKIYNLALRMLWSPDDAQDAGQEILLKIITNLSSFRKECKFSTWRYKIAANYLLTQRKKNIIENNISFEQFHEELGGFKTGGGEEYGVDKDLLLRELKIGCTHAMLLCLERDYRVIFILSVIFKTNSRDGAYIMEVTPETYRKRLSRAKKKISGFMENNCGLVNSKNYCHCEKRLNTAIEDKRTDPRRLLFVNNGGIENSLREMERLDALSSVYLSAPQYISPKNILENLKKIIESKRFDILSN